MADDVGSEYKRPQTHSQTYTASIDIYLFFIYTYSPQSEMMTFCFGLPSFAP